jgi:inhibitor of KinA
VTTGAETAGVRISAAGDAALVLQLPATIDPVINDRARAFALALGARWSAILRDVVIGYCTATVYYDPIRVDAQWLEAEMRVVAADLDEAPARPGATVEVPVCYDRDLAPDLDEVAAFGSCSADEVVEWHSGREYRVYMVGFIPGFAYMAEVDPRIAAPRRATPRATVPAGSVAIAGGQTGIYPATTPGGWNIIGRTPLAPYDPERGEPCLFQSGDRVKFIPITRAEFDRPS